MTAHDGVRLRHTVLSIPYAHVYLGKRDLPESGHTAASGHIPAHRAQAHTVQTNDSGGQRRAAAGDFFCIYYALKFRCSAPPMCHATFISFRISGLQTIFAFQKFVLLRF
jgi:hypothetical protein